MLPPPKSLVKLLTRTGLSSLRALGSSPGVHNRKFLVFSYQ